MSPVHDLMEVMPCACGDLPAHTHVYRPVQFGKRVLMVEDPYDVRIWVDWKAVAREAT